MLEKPADTDLEKAAMERLEIRKKEAAAAGHELHTEMFDAGLVAIQAAGPMGLLAKMALDGAEPAQIASVFAVLPARDKKKVQAVGKKVVKKKADILQAQRLAKAKADKIQKEKAATLAKAKAGKVVKKVAKKPVAKTPVARKPVAKKTVATRQTDSARTGGWLDLAGRPIATKPREGKKPLQFVGVTFPQRAELTAAQNPKAFARQQRVAEQESTQFGGFKNKDVQASAMSLPGQLPDGVRSARERTAGDTFFDPLRFCTGITEGRLCFYREVELKHGRVGMLASLGFLVGESFHPLFGGDIDVPSYLAFQQTPLQTFWPAVVAAIAVPEIAQLFDFNTQEANPWSMQLKRGNEDREIGASNWPEPFGVAGAGYFDPLGLKPTDPAELRAMQNKEINNGRLGMLGAAGMIAQELVDGEKIFDKTWLESNGLEHGVGGF
jgi:hypothetical protein